MYYRTLAVPNNRITCAVQDSELVLNFLMTRCGIANILELVTYIIYSTVLTRWDIDLAGISSYRSPPLPTNREFKSRLRRKGGSRGGRTKIRGGGVTMGRWQFTAKIKIDLNITLLYIILSV